MVKKCFQLFLCIQFFLFVIMEGVMHPSSAVTYAFSGGRFGDNLVSVAHAAWLSYSLGLPLVYQPFPYSEQLYLSNDSEVLHLKKSDFAKFYSLNHSQDYMKLWKQFLSEEVEENTLIQVPYYPEELSEHEMHVYAPYNQINWDEPGFLNLLRRLISPIDTMPDFQLPKNRVSVAVHIRTGGKVDRHIQEFYPRKSPSIEYYKDALQIILNIYKCPLYVFIFTDDVNPPEVVKNLAGSFSKSDIVFDCRWKGNQDDKNVLEDFFMLGNYECLVRSDSNFSLLASKLFSHKIVVSPFHVQMTRRKPMIDQFLVQIGVSQGISPLRTIIYK